MKHFILLLVCCTLGLTSCSNKENVVNEQALPRTIITTDGEVDDIDSFIRLLMYANEMDIRAIVYSSSMWHWAGDGKGTLLTPQNKVEGAGPSFPGMGNEPKESLRWIGTSWVQEHIDKYAECYPNLVKHDKNFPTPEYLRSIVKTGNIKVEGDMEVATEGSEFIKKIILEKDDSPIYVQIWGGTNTLARALLSIEEEHKETPQWEELKKQISRKVVVNIIQGQDGTYQNYVAKAWPEIRTVFNQAQFLSFAYMWRSTVPESTKAYLSGSWFSENILNNHGPLAAAYLGLGSGYDIGDPADHYGNPEMVKRMNGEMYDFISEGDSPSYFVLLDWGLRSLEHPEWGGFGGRYNKSDKGSNLYKDPQPEGGFRFGRQGQADEAEKPKKSLKREEGDFNPHTGDVDMWYPQARWIEALQNDFAARADWCVSDFDAANHRPTVSVTGGIDLTAIPGEQVVLEATTSDPDGDQVSIDWWQYREAGTSDCLISLDVEGNKVTFTVPQEAIPGTTLHIILEARDNGSPVLRSYQRVVVTVE